MLRKSISLTMLAVLAAGFSYAYRIGVARLLGVEAYGTVGVALAVFNIVSLVLLSAVPAAVAKFRAEGTKAYGTVHHFGALGAGLGVLLVLCWPLLGWTGLSFRLILLLALAIPIGMMMAVGRGVLQGRRQTDAFGVSQVIEESSKLLFAAILVWFGFGVWGAVAGLPLALLAVLVFVHSKMEGERGGVSIGLFKKIGGYSVPIAMTRIVDAFVLNIDLLFLKMWYPLSVVGMYAAAGPIARLPLLAFSSIATVLLPEVSADKKKAGRFTKKAVAISLAVLAGILVLIAVPQYFILLFGKEYVSAETVLALRLLALASFFVGLYKIFAASLQGLGKAKDVAVFTIVVLLADVGMNVWLVPAYGMVGAAGATLLASIFAAAGGWLIVRRA